MVGLVGRLVGWLVIGWVVGFVVYGWDPYARVCSIPIHGWDYIYGSDLYNDLCIRIPGFIQVWGYQVLVYMLQ